MTCDGWEPRASQSCRDVRNVRLSTQDLVPREDLNPRAFAH